MKLGKRVQITIGVEDVASSAEFFTSLQFQIVSKSADPYPSVQLTDGQNLILLNQDGMTYRGLVYFNPELNALVPELEAAGVSFFWKQPNEDGTLASAMFIDPTAIYGEDKNLGVNIVNQAPDKLYLPAGNPLTLCGTFGEFCSSVADYDVAAAFWAKLGFEPIEGGSTPYRFGVLSDGCMQVSAHQTPPDMMIPSPALTYFSADSAERVAKIKALGYAPSFEETDAAGNVVGAGFVGPGGQHIYIFNDVI